MTAPSAKVWYLTIDCRDPERLATFWSELLGVGLRGTMENFVFLSRPSEDAVALAFQRVPEDKVVKNRLHLDLRPDDRDAEVERLERMGARRVDIGQGPDVTWVVMADPEGNEFCVLGP